jgi:hypothetical protein
MSQHYTQRVFLRQAPNRLLEVYFAAKGLLGDISWKDLKETKIESIHRAILALPERERREIGRDFRAMWTLASARGAPLLNRIAKQRGIELTSVNSRQRTPYERAIWTFLEKPALFEEATSAGRWELLPRGLMEKWNGLPKVPPDTSDSTLADFAGVLSQYYLEEQDRGEYCQVEHFAYGQLDYFFAYPADYWRTLLSYEDDGELERKGLKPAFEAVIAYDRNAGTVEVCAEGGSKVRAELAARFAHTVLHVDQEPAPLPGVQYALHMLLDRNFVFTTQPDDNLELVRAKLIRVRWPGDATRHLTFEVDGRDIHANVHDLIDDVLRCATVSREELIVVGASIQAAFSHRIVSFDLTSSTCNLGDTPEELTLKEGLKRWGIDGTE